MDKLGKDGTRCSPSCARAIGNSAPFSKIRLKQLAPGTSVAVLEPRERPGGNVGTEEHDGFRVECGPNGFLDRIIGGGESNLSATLENMRQISDNLRDLTENAKRYPSDVLLGQPPLPAKGAQ
jgi:protoporphyrinogen oxidase